MQIKTLLADRSDLALIGLRTILEPIERIRIVGEAREAGAMHKMIAELQPDVVLIDHTAEGFGAEAIRNGLRKSPRTKFIAITPDPSQLALMSALRAGVSSYIKKDCGRNVRTARRNRSSGVRHPCGRCPRSRCAGSRSCR